jgi:TonB family protein
MGDEGTVLIQLSITPSGSVGDARIVWSECQRLDAAALTAVRQWRYEQVRVNGNSVPFGMVTEVPFRLPAEFKPQARRPGACTWNAAPGPTALALRNDTTVVLGHSERDLTGDDNPEVLRVIGVGPTIDHLEVTFTIQSAGQTIYEYKLMDTGPINEFSRWFFGKGKFETPAQFVATLTRNAPARVAEIPKVISDDRLLSDTVPGSRIWDEIQGSPVTIFTFSPGGDLIEAIAWNARAGRFYRLLNCC